MAVSKNHPLNKILQATKLGVLHFGENTVQEAEKKKEAFPEKGELHLIGHLQSNKINKALKLFNVIQTIDSYKLLQKLDKKAKEINKIQRIYYQINIGKDPNKSGFTEKELIKVIPKTKKFANIKLEGIMTILPQNKKKEERKELFLKTKKIRDDIARRCKIPLELSMGMSQDYKEAIECGATIIRVGSKIFGNRQ